LKLLLKRKECFHQLVQFLASIFNINDEIFINTEKLLPPTDYYVNLLDKSIEGLKSTNRTTTRRVLPKIDALLEWGIVKAGDTIIPKDRDGEGILLKNGNVAVDGKEMSLQVWLKEVYGWSSVQTYAFAVHKDSGKTLSQLRREYMSRQAAESEL
jgi:hypothetical protein